MAGRIPRDFIDDLIARSDIVDIVDNRVKLKKAGKNYQACCPFHNEKTPSFTVSQDKQFYHCFGCGAHGNVVSFIMEYDRLEFPDAIEELARYHGVDVPREQGRNINPAEQREKRQQKEDDYALMEKVAQFFAHQLKHHQGAQRPIEYLKNRGLSGELVKRFGIGYAPPEWDGALAAFGNTPERQQQLLDLKIITQNDKGRRFDFFRDRIMFPIRDRRGRVIGFGGRVLDNEDGPKYLNSPETRIFFKGSELYGLFQARQAHRTLQRVLVVEGYMDVVALAQYGIDYAVAALGTSTTPEHIQLLFRNTTQVVCCYDGDRAGRDAAWRALENALPYLKDGVELKFMFLPDGEDPDSMVRQEGQSAFEQRIERESIPVSRFMFENLLKRHHVGSEEGKAALLSEAQKLIDQVSGENQQRLLEDRLASIVGSNRYVTDLQRDIAKANESAPAKRALQSGAPGKSQLTPVRILLRLLLEHPAIASECEEVRPELLSPDLVPGIRLLTEIHGYCSANPRSNSAQLLEHFRDHNDFAQLSKLLVSDQLGAHDSIAQMFEQSRQQVYRDSFARLVERQLHSRMEELLAKSRVGQLSEQEKQELKALLSTQS